MATKTKKQPNAFDVIKKPNTSVVQNFELPEGDNSKYTAFALDIMRLPDYNRNDPAQLSARVTEYFEMCVKHDMKPAVAALALALKLDRRRLWEINNDIPHGVKISDECRQIIKQVYASLELLWESYSINGKVNPVTSIFLGKNNFGYQDKQEYVLTPNQSTTIDVKAIESKYDDLPE